MLTDEIITHDEMER